MKLTLPIGRSEWNGLCFDGEERGPTMAKFKKIIVAGPLVIEAVYPAPSPRDSQGVRRGKRALSSQAQRQMNLKYAWQKLELEIAANFGVRDLWATLTYDDAHLPRSREEARACFRAFIKRLRAARRARGQELRYLYVTEHRHGGGRWHHHALINAAGEDYGLLWRLWGRGNVELRPIRIDRDRNYETLARYMCKEQRDKVGQRLWSGSKGLRRPVGERFRVPNGTPLSVPKGAALTLADTGDVATAYGHYRYIKYLAADWEATTAPKAKRRRRRGR